MSKRAGLRFRAFVSAKRRFTDFVEKKFSIQAHMWLIIIGTVLSGVLFSRFLLALRITSMGIRYPIAVLLSYGAFFSFIKLWFLFVIDAEKFSNLGPSARVPEAEEKIIDDAIRAITPAGLSRGSGTITAQALEEARAGEKSNATSGENVTGALDASVDLADAGFSVGDMVAADEGCAVGCVAFGFVGFLVGFIYIGSAWLIFEAPAILSEALFQALLAGSLLRRMRQMEAPNWVGGVFGLTWKLFLLMAFLAMGTGIIAKASCPMAIKISEVMACPHSKEQHERFSKPGSTPLKGLPTEIPPGAQGKK